VLRGGDKKKEKGQKRGAGARGAKKRTKILNLSRCFSLF
tara:strand:+ start:178 stop:294 length:117 start_codon:yes stop_codon:yes gene_type:complete